MSDIRRRALHIVYSDGEPWFEWQLACGHLVKRGWEYHAITPPNRVRCRACSEPPQGDSP